MKKGFIKKKHENKTKARALGVTFTTIENSAFTHCG